MVKDFVKVDDLLNKNQSLSKYSIENFTSNVTPNITNNLTANLLQSAYSKKIEKAEYIYDGYTSYNYETGTLENSILESKQGITIPYNFYGDINKSFTFTFHDGVGTNLAIHKAKINTTQHIEKPVIGFTNGMVKMNLKEKDDFEKNNLKYAFSTEDINEMINLESSFKPEYLNKYLKENHE
ncbi:UNVERIFIED_CONTAM: hypothetical protein O8I53_06120 [Campylobacter lari]